jgi:hypothetical protein
MLVYFMTIWNILRPFDIIYGRFVWLVVIWYIFPKMVCLDQEKSGNPDPNRRDENLLAGPFLSISMPDQGCQMVYIFKPKIPSWVNFGVSCKERCW